MSAEVERRAKHPVRAMYVQAAEDHLDDDKSKALVKHALPSEGHKAIGAMVRQARRKTRARAAPRAADPRDDDPVTAAQPRPWPDRCSLPGCGTFRDP
jgi:hypothetical protein